MLEIKPFVKWVGGKGQLLEKLNLIIENREFDRIVEPFVGGGAFFINQKKRALINDVNEELITTYKVIKRNPRELISKLQEYEKMHSEAFFINLRKNDSSKLNDIEKSCRFIYLNKAGFNGMYRVNSKGEFNVPFGKKEKVNIFDKKNILNLSYFFNSIDLEIYNATYTSILKNVKKGDLVFIDPPYDKEEADSFTSYQKEEFGRKEQENLVKIIDDLNKRGIKFILTNSNTNFINESYKKYNKIIVNANRMINSNSNNRINSAKEVIIFNFEISNEVKKMFKFIELLETMFETNKQIDKLVDWNKIWKATEENLFFLNELNYLFCSSEQEFERKIKFLYEKSKESFKLLPLLVATREEELEIYDINNDLIEFNFNKDFDLDKAIKFLKETNLMNIFINNKVKNLQDYFVGVEVGLDTNARKNRSGKFYEEEIKKILKKYNIDYKEQSKVKDIDINLDNKKVFDFVFKINGINYLVEVNFYNSTGSKLNSISREYIELNEKIKNSNKYEFIWITDGKGWKSTKRDLVEAYMKIDNLFNRKLFEDWLISKLS